MSKKITLEDLAIMTNKGFTNVQEQIISLDKKVDTGFLNINARLDLLEKDVRDIRQKLHQGIDRDEFFELENRLTLVEEKLGIKY